MRKEFRDQGTKKFRNIDNAERVAVLTAAAAVRLSSGKTMRNRYVSQVLLATLGFGMLLGVIAVLQTPADGPRQGAGTSAGPAEPPQCGVHEPVTHAPKATAPSNDYKDDCLFPVGLTND